MNNESKHLELERGTLVNLFSDENETKKNYIIVQVKDVFFDNELNSFLRRYIVRELKNNKLSHDKIEILSNDIEEIKTVKEVRDLYNDMEYSEEGDKELDNEENNSMKEEIEPSGNNLNNFEEPGEVDYDISDFSDDIIVDMDDDTFEFTEVLDDVKEIEIEEELKESEILFTEYEQEEDIIDEMIRLLPPNKKFDKKEIKKIGERVRRFQFLKNKYSEYSLYQNEENTENKDNLESLKQNVLLKGQNYKPIMNEFYKNNFKNQYLIPIVQTNLKLYEKDQNEEMKDKEVSSEILEQIELSEKIVNKYRNNMELDYELMNSELEELYKSYRLNTDYKTKKIIKLKNDFKFINNYDVNNKDFLEFVNFLGEDTRNDEYDDDVTYNKGERINITGFVHIPEVFNYTNNKNLLVNKCYSKPLNLSEIYESKKEENKIEIKEIDGNNRFQIGQKIKVCIKDEDINIIGVIKDVRRGFIYVEPDNKKLIDLDKNILEFDLTSKLLKINKINEILDYKDKCYKNEDNDKIRVFLFSRGIITDKNYENILDSIIPSSKVILDREIDNISNIINYHDLNNILEKYNLSFTDLEKHQSKRINKILEKNEKKIFDINASEVAKLNRSKTTYFKDLKAIEDKRLKEDYDFISNKNLIETEKFYTKYIYQVNSFDNTIQRFDWLYSQEDYGRVLLLQKLLLKIQDEKKKVKVADIEGKIKEIEEENGRIKNKLIDEERKNDFFNLKKKNKCREVETKIVKIYLTLRELEEDNYKNLTVDNHYLIGDPNNPINKVKPGDYCILKHPDNPSKNVDKIDMSDKIFKRINVGDEKQEIWVLESKLKINDFLSEAENYCNKLIGLGKEDETNDDKCSLDKKTAQCLPNRIMRLRKGYRDNEEVIEKLNKKVKTIDNREKEEKIELLLKLYQNRAVLNLFNIKSKVESKRKEVKLERDIPLEIDESELLDYTFLKRLEDDISNPEKKEELLIDLRTKYGIDFIDNTILGDDEKEIFTMGDFNDKGQRIEITEVMPNENEKVEVEMSNNDILDAVKSFLSDTTNMDVYKEEYKKSGNDSYEKIENIIDTLLNIMGVNVNKDKLVKVCLVLVEENLLNYNEFIQNKYVNRGKSLPKKSKIESQYNGYRLQTLIFITSARLLVYLQLELNNYFVNPFEKCIANIFGYPLTDIEDLTGVEYIACVLNNLSKSGKYWESISEFNKGKIVKRLLTYLEMIVSNVNVKLKLEEKLLHIEKIKLENEEIEQCYVWNEFRPPLNSLVDNSKKSNLDYDDINCKSKKSIKAGLSEFKEDNFLNSLKIIDRINNIIDSQEIENVIYDPIPLGNICCLSGVEKEYNYFQFLIEKDSDNGLTKLIEKSKNMEKCEKMLGKNDIDITYLKPSKTRQKLKSFANNIFPKKKDIDDIVDKLYNNFISEGHNLGRKRIFDIKNICQITGQHKSELKGNKYSRDNYFQLLSSIHNYNRVQLDNDLVLNSNNNKDLEKIESVENEDNSKSNSNQINNLANNPIMILTINRLKKILDKDVFKENKYLRDLVEKDLDNIINKSGNEDIRVWDRMEQEIVNEKVDLIKVLSKSVDRKNIMMLDKIIDNLTRFKNLETDDNILIQETENEENKFKLKTKSKLRQFKRSETYYNKYIMNYLKKYINILANKNMNYNSKIEDSSSLKIKKTEKIMNDINEDEYGFLNKYRNGRCRNLFRNLKNVINEINDIKNIKGYDDIYDCNNNIIHKSRFNFINSAKLLEFLFVYLLNLLIDSSDNIKDKKKIKINKESRKNIDESEEDEIIEIGTDNHSVICNFVVDLLFKIEQDRKFNDRYSQSLVDKNIKTKNEESKDRNLLTMELLDLETRRLRNELTKAGITKYADLASDFKDLLDEEENNRELLEQFKKIHGNNFTEDQFENFKENREKELRIEEEIRKDNEEYLDAEGDDEMEI